MLKNIDRHFLIEEVKSRKRVYRSYFNSSTRPNELKRNWPRALWSVSALDIKYLFVWRDGCTDNSIWFPVQTCPLITHNLSLVQGGIHTQTQLETCWFPSMPCSHSWPPSVTLSLDSPPLLTSTLTLKHTLPRLPPLTTCWRAETDSRVIDRKTFQQMMEKKSLMCQDSWQPLTRRTNSSSSFSRFCTVLVRLPLTRHESGHPAEWNLAERPKREW